MELNIENHSGSPHVFATAWAKDMLIALISESREVLESSFDDPTLTKRLETSFKEWEDIFHKQIMKDRLRPLSDGQLTKIESLLHVVKLENKVLEHLRGKMYNLNVMEASELIQSLLEAMPDEMYRDYLNSQKDRSAATRQASDKDGFYSR